MNNPIFTSRVFISRHRSLSLMFLVGWVGILLSPYAFSSTTNPSTEPTSQKANVDQGVNVERFDATSPNAMPQAAANDAATNARCFILRGQADPNGGTLDCLHDGVVGQTADAPQASFFFAQRTEGGQIVVDLGKLTKIQKIRTFSRHGSSRAPQVYTVYGYSTAENLTRVQLQKIWLESVESESAGSESAAVAETAATSKSTKPKTAPVWQRLATVDTRSTTESTNPSQWGGTYVVTIDLAKTAERFPKLRYLLFDVQQTESNDPFGNTFYQEIDVLDGKKYTPIPLDKRPIEITFDTAAASPELQQWVETTLSPICETWYPKLVQMLPSEGFTAPRHVEIIFRPGNGVAATGGTTIICDIPWFEKNREGEAAGAVIHELVHVVQQYRGGPGRTPNPVWLVEGLTDYIRWFIYEPKLRAIHIDPDRAKYTDSYQVTATFLQYVLQKYDANLIVKLNTVMREGRYTPAVWSEWTGHTLDELWTEFTDSLRRQTSQLEQNQPLYAMVSAEVRPSAEVIRPLGYRVPTDSSSDISLTSMVSTESESREPTHEPTSDPAKELGTTSEQEYPEEAQTLDQLAERFLKLALETGEHVSDFVDAYYGPEAWRTAAKEANRTPAVIEADTRELLAAIQTIRQQLDSLAASQGSVSNDNAPTQTTTNQLNPACDSNDFADLATLLSMLEHASPRSLPMLRLRALFLEKQTLSMWICLRIQQGYRPAFDTEIREIYDITAPTYSDEQFDVALRDLDAVLPQVPDQPIATLAERYQFAAQQVAIPMEKYDAVFQKAIEAARQKCRENIPNLPANEAFEVEYVHGAPWGAYAWYQGNYRTKIQVNLSDGLPISSPVGLATHEGYPGHHVYYSLVEQQLVRRFGWLEHSMMVLYSPQAVLAEGAATLAPELAFPGEESMRFERDQLAPIAGIEPAAVEQWYRINQAARGFRAIGIEQARRYLLAGKASQEEKERRIAEISEWTRKHSFRNSFNPKFLDTYRSYIATYTIGEDLLNRELEKLGAGEDQPARRWNYYRQLLSTPLVPSLLTAP